ncbi:hypothetical protein BGX24_010682 [Mortierella sp. AD032]|nr:hypothetical protein BGX24_010682 [Mortierella sp. AD032]
MHGSAYYITVPSQSADSRSMYVRTTVPSSWSRTVGLGLRHTNYCQPQVSSQPMFPEQQQYSGTNSCSIPYQPTAMHAPVPMQSGWPQVSESRYGYQPNMVALSAQQYHYQQQYSGTNSYSIPNQLGAVHAPVPMQSGWPQVYESHYNYQPNMTVPSALRYNYQQQYSSTNSSSIPNQPTAMHVPVLKQSDWPQVSESRCGYQPNMVALSAQQYH